MRLLFQTLRLLIVFITFAPPILAQTTTPKSPKDSVSNQLLEETVITANRYSTNRFGSPMAIDILSQKTMRERQVRTTPEAMQQMPGIWVQKTNHGGGSPFVRGLTGNQTLLLIDGIRLNNATYRYGPNQYLNTIDVFSLDRIEMLRGSGSVQYGSDALGGAIQVITANPEFQARQKLSAYVLGRAVSANMEQSTRGVLGYANRNAAMQGGFTYRNFGDLLGGDTTGRQVPTGYEEMAFDGKLKLKTGKNTSLTLAHYETRQMQVPVFHKIQLENFARNEMDPQLHRLSYARWEGHTDKKAFSSWSLIASRQQTEEGRNSQKKGSTTLRQENDRVRTYGFTSNIISKWTPYWTANTGAELYTDLVNSTRADIDQTTQTVVSKRGLYPDQSVMTSWAVFSLHTLQIQRWIFNAGVRYNGFQIRIEDDAVGAVALRPQAFVWNTGVQRRIHEHLHVFATYETAFRAPNIDDLGTLGIVDFRYEVPNYDLRPEHAQQAQVGFKYKNSHLHIEMYCFQNRITDLITRIKVPDQVIQTYPVYQKENTDISYIRGLEYQMSILLTKHWVAEGFIAYLYGQNTTANEPMRRIPPLNGRLALRFQPNRFFASAEWLAADQQTRLAAGDKADNRIPTGGTPGWQVVNCYMGYQTTAWSIRLSGQNLLNRDYRYHGSGVNGIGRSIALSADIQF